MPSPRKAETQAAPKGRYLRRFTLQNVRTFRSPITLDFCHPDGSVAQWTVILGENGTGKTTLLQFLAGMIPTEREKFGLKDLEEASAPMLVRPEWHAWHTANLPPTKSREVDLSAKLFVSSPAATLADAEENADEHASLDLQIGFHKSWSELTIASVGTWNAKTIQYANELRLFGYGANRHVAGPSSPYLTSETFFKNGGGEPASTLFHDDYPLISPEQWLLGLDHAGKGGGENSKVAKRAFASARRCLINLLPDVEDVSVHLYHSGKQQPQMALFCKTPYGLVPFGALSLGYRTMAAWLTDFLKRMHEAFPQLEEPDNGPAIVLIDEFDLHMHPALQRKAMAALTKEFPNTQFIVTAHSPIIVQATEGQAKLIVLRRKLRKDRTEEVIADDDPKVAAGWRVDQILESLYDMSPRTETYSKLVERIVELRQKPDLKKSEQSELYRLEAQLDREAPPSKSEASKQFLAELQTALHGTGQQFRLK
jgi:energy-coupling factor transporter ATP-binding protein EcfA2